MKKSAVFIICFLFILCSAFLFAEEGVQEGDAVMCPAGFFPDRGYYGASDSLTVGSIVKVTNKSSNKSVDVYIVDKADSFLVLSYDAALKIDLKRKTTAEVQVSLIRAASVTKSDKRPDKIVPVSKKSYQILPANEVSLGEDTDEDEAAAEFDNIKNKVVAFIAPEDENQSAGQYISADNVGKSLPRQPADTCYVQLGFYSSLDNAENIAYTVQSSYPILIVTKDMPTYMGYRVLVGPVSLSDKEDVLEDFRDAGFSDAFASINE